MTNLEEIPVRYTGERVCGSNERVIDWVRWGDIADKFEAAKKAKPNDYSKVVLPDETVVSPVEVFRGVVAGLTKDAVENRVKVKTMGGMSASMMGADPNMISGMKAKDLLAIRVQEHNTGSWGFFG